MKLSILQKLYFPTFSCEEYFVEYPESLGSRCLRVRVHVRAWAPQGTLKPLYTPHHTPQGVGVCRGFGFPTPYPPVPPGTNTAVLPLPVPKPTGLELVFIGPKTAVFISLLWSWSFLVFQFSGLLWSSPGPVSVFCWSQDRTSKHYHQLFVKLVEHVLSTL